MAVVNAYLVIDPKGDRPYLSTNLSPHLDRSKVKVYHYALLVPDDPPPDNPLTLVTPEKE
jgi:hypothetical protein